MATTQAQLDAGVKYSDIQASQAGKTADQIAQTAVETTNRLSSTPTTTAIPADNLGTMQAFDMPTPSLDTSKADGLVAGAETTTKTLADYLKEQATPETATSKQYGDLLSQINTLLPGMANKGVDQLKAEQDAKLPGLKKQLGEINAQIVNRLAQYNKQVQGESLAPGETPLPIVMGRQAVIQRNEAADIGLLQARALGLQGNIAIAQETANRAIDLKYDTLQDTLNVKMEQLKLIQPILDKEERQQAAALERKYLEQDRKYAEDREKSKSNLELAFNTGTTSKFANKGGEMFRVSDGKPYGSIQEFFKDAGVSSFEEAYQRGLVTDITAQTVADTDFVMKLREAYPDAGIDFYDDAQSAVDKLAGSNKYLRENTPDTPEQPKPVSINGQDYFFDPSTGTYVPASAFIEGEAADGNTKYISNTGGQLKLGAGEVDTLTGFDSTISSADNALKLLQEGVKTGPLSSANLSLTKKLGTADAKSLQLEQILAQITANFTKSLSGAAVSEQEVKRLQAFLPQFSDQEGTIQSKLQTLKSEMATKKNIFLETKGGQLNPNFVGTSAANATGNQVKGMTEKLAPLPYMSVGATPTKSGGTLLSSIVNKVFPPGSVGGQCGDFVRKVVTKMGATYPRLGDSLKSKIAAVQKYGTSAANGRIGSVIVTKENPTYGHVAYIIGRNAKGWIVGESNFKQSNRVSYGRIIPYGSPKIVGVINPTKYG